MLPRLANGTMIKGLSHCLAERKRAVGLRVQEIYIHPRELVQDGWPKKASLQSTDDKLRTESRSHTYQGETHPCVRRLETFVSLLYVEY